MLYSNNIHFNKGKITFTDKHNVTITTKDAFERAFVRVGSWLTDLELMVLHFVSDHVPFHSLRLLFFRL